jgi:hypothetical protein
VTVPSKRLPVTRALRHGRRMARAREDYNAYMREYMRRRYAERRAAAVAAVRVPSPQLLPSLTPGGVAQLVEQDSLKIKVVGSKPTAPTQPRSMPWRSHHAIADSGSSLVFFHLSSLAWIRSHAALASSSIMISWSNTFESHSVCQPSLAS